ncbi:unnamed protein product [Dracunculus medinensis]|uniref:MFS domain-containing protein n=1 Tax=Dracunculus medinensis TaxID=318479 RepID=A0A0N4U1D5_DRAME|nr:unnamed protein product [Dracunculus medinensis]
MASYALALFYWGWLGDRVNSRNVLIIGMIGSAVMLILFGFVPKWRNFYSYWYYILIYILFALFQACGWPNVIAIMGNWYSGSNRGFVMGIWCSCQAIGNIFSSLLIALILPFGYEYTFLLNSSLMILVALFVFLIENAPRRCSVPSFNNTHDEDSLNRTGRHLGLFEALLLPGVIPYSLCTACLKLVNYAFFFWLPLCLSARFGWTEQSANFLSIWFDIGGIIGSMLVGVISDRCGCKSPIVVLILLCAIGALFLYTHVGGNVFVNALIMTFVGFTVSGPYNFIAATISIDLGSQPLFSSNAEAMATVSGIVDGIGSLSSAFGQLIIPLIEIRFGWDYVFYFFIILVILSIFPLLRQCFADLKTFWMLHEEGANAQNETEPLLE